LAKEAFTKTDLLSTNFMYLGTDSLVTSDGVMKPAIGFNSNGEAFLNSYNIATLENDHRNRNSLETAQQIAMYRVNGNEIQLEKFVATDFGQYVLWTGTIQGDTLRFEQKNWPNRPKEFIYVKSNLSVDALQNGN